MMSASATCIHRQEKKSHEDQKGRSNSGLTADDMIVNIENSKDTTVSTARNKWTCQDCKIKININKSFVSLYTSSEYLEKSFTIAKELQHCWRNYRIP